MTTPDQPTPAQVLELLAELREARTQKLGLVRNGKRDLALTSLINELDNRVMEIPAATLRAQAAALASKEAEVERLRGALGHIESLERRARKRVNELHAEGMSYTTTYEETVERAQILARPAGIARQALTPAQEAPQ